MAKLFQPCCLFFSFNSFIIYHLLPLFTIVPGRWSKKIRIPYVIIECPLKGHMGFTSITETFICQVSFRRSFVIDTCSGDSLWNSDLYFIFLKQKQCMIFDLPKQNGYIIVLSCLIGKLSLEMFHAQLWTSKGFDSVVIDD